MKIKNSLFTTISIILLYILAIQVGCKKDDNEPDPNRMKYAWATGKIDSTGYGMLLFTPDAGETWTRQAEGDDIILGRDLLDIWAIDEHNVWATGEKNTLIKTSDGGASWNKVQLPAELPETTLASIYIDEQTNIWIAGSTGQTGIIYKSTNGGNTFSLLDTTFFQSNGVQGIWITESEKVYVAGLHNSQTGEPGFIAFSKDSGESWEQVIPGDNYNKWEWISVVSSGTTIVVYGGKGHYIVSTDDGKNWENDSIPVGGVDGADINHMIMLDDQTWWAVCDLGNVWITSNGGVQWTQQTNLPPDASGSFMVGLDSWDRDIALMVGSGFYWPPISPILKTEDGGNSWTKAYECSVPLWKISFIKE